MDLSKFSSLKFLPALKAVFKDLQIPLNYLTDEPTPAKTILKDTWKDNTTFDLIKDVYFLGMVDDAAFSGKKSIDVSEIKSDYDGILIFGVTLRERENNRLPTRSQLAEITRAFNREYFYTPVIVVFQYSGYLAFACAERLKYKQEWREGEKAGKVSLLRDIHLIHPHAGHLRILNDLKIPDHGKKKVDSFAKLYAWWQDVFSVGILNKTFYQEISNWFFWAVKEVAFPNSPVSLIHKLNEKEQALKHEHNAKNVIRLLTRFLFVWFIKEKKLIPEELFNMDYLKNELLNDVSTIRDDLYKHTNIESVYYKAILQNLFFASLNCPIEPTEDGDNRHRGFRLKDNYGQHRDANYLMRYQEQFKSPEKFIELINASVPFLNGGLFECLDNKTDKIYIDGFSDNLPSKHKLIVPDYLFFGFDQEVDLSGVVGIHTNVFKSAKVKGLISILKSYKFTITENTPIEEDVALDPELLGKVFENLLASYNPETKTTARKQTGSFYTPREIVTYMVDESLIAYLKNSVKNCGIDIREADKKFHELLSYDDVNPFAENIDLQKQIIHALDTCKILDPACGSGAFPMGILQKMVHILQKLDPKNTCWQELQLKKAMKDTEGAFAIADKKSREQKLIEINDAFDENINDPDYARKLFLVENCIYGVDIQPIAAQISKLRFFISLVVDQKVDKTKPNFSIRALPNLETKFVAANTLIGIEKPKSQMNLFDNREIKNLEQELKNVRHRLFSAKSPTTKRRLRDKDKEIREQIGTLLLKHGWGNETAKQLAGWDPYDQNASSPFFDSEWMFGVSGGFDVVIGNPPYGAKLNDEIIERLKGYELFCRETAILFIEKGNSLLCEKGILTYIVPKPLIYASNYNKTRLFLMGGLRILVDCGKAFEQVKLEATVFSYKKSSDCDSYRSVLYVDNAFKTQDLIPKKYIELFGLYLNGIYPAELKIGVSMNSYEKFGGLVENKRGSGLQKYLSDNHGSYKAIGGMEIDRYGVKRIKGLVDYETLDANRNSIIHSNSVLCQNIVAHIHKPIGHIKITCCIVENKDYVILDTINQLSISNKNFSKYFLWTLLNSDLINWYVYRFIYGKAIRTMHFDNPVSSRIPLALPDKYDSYRIFYYGIVHNSEIRLDFENILNGLVFELYFSEHMKANKIDIIQFVEKDLKQVMQGREFEKLTDDQKKKVIDQLHTRWTDPENEIVKRMKSFAKKSPDILKPILEC
ncbi:MAG: hypothetical protein HQK75_16550 [Candidatus Magnetomorum sp.]|nr:hypothetical protein [Candidatus Magnetomorum sp.]